MREKKIKRQGREKQKRKKGNRKKKKKTRKKQKEGRRKRKAYYARDSRTPSLLSEDTSDWNT